MSADISSYATIFDVTTDIDFFAKTVDVNSTNTQCADAESSGCAENPDALDFSTQETFIYVIGDKVGFRGDVALKADSTFTGIIDARFYGTKAQELGSIFAMRDETGGYYYGAFGGEREGVVVPSVFNTILGNEKVTVAETIAIDDNIDNNFSHDSLIALADAGDGTAFTMNALAVYKDDTTDYIRAPNRGWDRADTTRVIGLAKINGTAASLTFDVDHNISGVTAYLNSKTYTANIVDGTPTAMIFNATRIDGADSVASTALINVHRGSEFFGFDSNYMAHISWSLIKTENELATDALDVRDDIYDIDGTMLAGIETVDASIPSLGKQVEFMGKGQGSYGSLTESYDTIFDVKATVDFDAGNVAILNSSDTCKASDGLNCGNDAASFLDFSITSAPIYYNSNNISGDVALKSNTDFKGMLDARFYGSDAWEFGGTFALTDGDSNSYYYGAFGAVRGGIVKPFVLNVTISDKTVTLPSDVVAPTIPIDTVTSNSYQSLTAIAATDKAVVLKGLSVYKDDTTDYIRAPNRDWATYADKVTTTSIFRLTDSATSIVFSGINNGVTLYTNDVYTNDDVSIEVDRSVVFGFGANYMAYINWEIDDDFDNPRDGLTGSVSDYSGKMLAGIETLHSAIPLTGILEFKGKGRGTYGEVKTSDDVVFKVLASVDFNGKNVTFISSDTCKAFDGADCGDNGADRLDYLNFTSAILGFADKSGDAVNRISGAVVMIDTKNKLAGTLDARFYGGATEELGGTFALTNSSNFYYGVFGALRSGITASAIFDATIANEMATPNATISTGYNSLTDVANAADSFTMRALSVYKDDTTIYTRTSSEQSWATEADKAQTIKIANITGSAASLTFDGGGNISNETLYTNDANVNNSATITVDRSSGFFGFDSNYMAYINWETDNDFDDKSTGLTGSVVDYKGAMLAGIETININLKGEVDFEGKGRGTYGDANGSYDTVFDVTASVDFDGEKNVTISSSKTCEVVVNADCGIGGTDRVDNLNFNTGEITFTANSISATNFNVNGMGGRLDARFYGSATQEFGGTFAFASNLSYYYGVFGAERNGITASIVLEPITDASVSGKNATAITTAIDNNGNYVSLADVTSATFTVKGLSVYQDDSTEYTRASQNKDWVSKADKKQIINIANITGSAASLTFDGGGNISNVTLYTNDADVNTTATITVDRSIIFGFASNDMAYISWGSMQTATNLDNSATTDTLTNINGAMLAGIETDNSNILTFGATRFTGKGRGTYREIADNVLMGYDTVFTVTASVDFANTNVTISSSETCEMVVNADCAVGGANRHDFLNFSTDTITYTGNSISGNVALTENNQFRGTLDARFYGYIGREFGGTFAMSNANSYYYGGFGAEREALYNFMLNSNNIAAPLSATIPNGVARAVANDSNGNEYVSLYHATDDANGQDRKFTMNALAVNAIDETDYVRALNKAWGSADRNKDVTLAVIENSLASLTINGSGQLSVASIYLNDNIPYTADASSLNKTTLSGNINNLAGFSTKITVSRDASLFGFESSDMVYIDWEISQSLPTNAQTTKVDNIKKRHGMMIAGIETEFLSIPTVNLVMFTGKGRGYYGNVAGDTGSDTIFDVTAIVDFADKNIRIGGSNTCEAVVNADCAVGGANRKVGLDFTTEEINYYGNEISGDVTAGGIGAGSLTGRLDARFYGDGGHKLGGTFALSDVDSYYYGAFGTQRRTPITQFKFNETLASESGPESTVDFLITNQTQHDSLHAVALADGSNSFTINGLAVYQSNQIDYARVPNKGWGDASTDTDQEITIGRLSDSGAAIIFDGNGNISGIATYLSINPYIATNIYTATVTTPISNTDVLGQTINSDDTPDDTTKAVMNIYRGESFFGFKSYYMSYIDWRVTRKFTDLGDGTIDRSYDYSGAMLAGLETAGASISRTGIFTFSGKGQGVYHNSKTGAGGQTRFDVTANVNFSSRRVTINSSHSFTCADFSNIGTCTSNHNIGEFSTGSTPIYYAYRKNNISTTDVTANIAGNSLTGTLDARFYGGDGYELGGTFALSNETYYYYGAFGAQRPYTSLPEMVATTHSGTPTTFNANNLTGFNDSNRASKTNNALPTTTAVLITKNNTTTNQTIKTENITGAVVEFTYDSDGDFADDNDGLIFYVADKKYRTAYGYGITDYIADLGPVDAGDADAPLVFGLSKRSSLFGFTPAYMARVSWQLEETAYNAYGYAITGFETLGSNIPTTGNAIFGGKGWGRYVSATTSNITVFDVTANVDFNNRNVVLSSANTCTYISGGNCLLYQLPQLNFTSTLDYNSSTNAISGAIATIGDGYTNLTGTVDARFYGNGTDKATEFGGTFNLYNNQAVYIGYFGVRELATINFISTSHADTPTSFNQHNLTGFNDTARFDNGTPDDTIDDVGKTNNALPATAVQITKQRTGNQTITTDRITGAVAEFDYESGGAFADNGFRFYLTDKKYSITGGDGVDDARIGQDYIIDYSPDAGAADAPSSGFGLSKFSDDFGFTPAYMAKVHWGASKTAYYTYGFAITGFEMIGTAIPTAGNVVFTGKGRGQYYSITASAVDYIYLNVTANVNFATREVGLASDNTCNSSASNCPKARQRPHLDFTGNLSYAAGTNAISGNIIIAGSGGNAMLTGTADARFYGPNAEEFGGTFSFSHINDDGKVVAGYVGWFGLRNNGAITAPSAPIFNHNNLTGFADNARNNTSNNKLLAIAASITKNNDKSISNTGITTAAIEFAYDSNGDFTDGEGFTLHLPDRKYSTIAGAGGTTNYLLASDSDKTKSVNDNGDIDKADRLGFSKSNGVFGFTAEYMATARWRVTEDNNANDDYETIGYAIAGFDTIGTDIPTAGGVILTGKGFGQYYENNTAFVASASATIAANRYYNVTAIVDFNKRNVNLSTTNTCSSRSGTDCAQASYQEPEFDWTGELNYVAGKNILTGNVETAGGNGNIKLTGTAEARFYGPLVQELGGMFNMSNATSDYVGFFGAQQQVDNTIATNHADTPTAFNANGLTGFNDTARNGTTGNALQAATAVQITKKSDNTITNDRITGAVAEITYASDRDLHGLSFYYADKKYRTNSNGNYQNHIIDDTPDSFDADTPNQFGMSRSSFPFNFVANYMARIYWGLDETAYDAYGYAITGFETLGSNIPTSGTAVSFTGKGQGQYYTSAGTGSKLPFSVTATANFTTRNIGITTEHDGTSNDNLNLTGNLSYDAGTNAISGTVETAGDADNAKLTGTADARFYGPAAEELGGTFSMSNADAGYVGFFGVKK
ncbi:MAG: transferrin-binding protein-like solute binding protein [Alphaproteobacteria bacterium]|nr:transferrin-binding protein-like solute binding protein [Alphaproteobacteria bacterium]